jgi:hypothetical protein
MKTSGFIIDSILAETGEEHPYISFLRWKQIPAPNKSEYPDLSMDEFYECIHDPWRLQFDADARMLGDLRADVAVSLWTPTQYLIKGRTKVLYLSSEKYCEHIHYISHLEVELAKPCNSELLEMLDQYALEFYERGNMYLLPQRAMNRARTSPRYKGDKGWLKDRIDITLSESFPGDFLGKYFDSTPLKKWIDGQQLQMLFKDEEIAKSNVKPLGECGLTKLYNYMTEDELIAFLDDTVEFIRERTRRIMHAL